jgi:Ran GTPase-activating protein (RanGAP) involved in mRNA processing and transport
LERPAPLDELCFIESGVNDDMVFELVHVFRRNPHLAPKKLQFAANEVGNIGCQTLAMLLKKQNCAIETLDLCDNFIEDEGAACLADALIKNRTLKELRLEGNRITTMGWAVFARVRCHVTRQYPQISYP